MYTIAEAEQIVLELPLKEPGMFAADCCQPCGLRTKIDDADHMMEALRRSDELKLRILKWRSSLGELDLSDEGTVWMEVILHPEVDTCTLWTRWSIIRREASPRIGRRVLLTRFRRCANLIDTSSDLVSVLRSISSDRLNFHRFPVSHFIRTVISKTNMVQNRNRKTSNRIGILRTGLIDVEFTLCTAKFKSN